MIWSALGIVYMSAIALLVLIYLARLKQSETFLSKSKEPKVELTRPPKITPIES
jgi:hypothetical protein